MADLKNVLLGLFALLALVDARPAFPGKILDRASDTRPSYDYVIVGGGLSGLVVANRLSEHRSKSFKSRTRFVNWDS